MSWVKTWPEWPWNWPEVKDPAAPARLSLGFCLLTALWAVLAWWRWGRWGDLTIDCGREMLVPWAITQGKVLYRDIWYSYGPLGPYFNALLFQVFGASLSVLYTAGLIALLLQAVALYMGGVLLSSPLTGFVVGAAVLVQSLSYGIFNYALPYSYAAVYGSVFAAIVLVLALRAARSEGPVGLLAAGVFAGLALISKLEYGAACFAVLGLLVAGRLLKSRNWLALARDLLCLLPGVAICIVVAAWMISLRGVSFITQDNISSWPTGYFMKVYGRHWLEVTGGVPSTYQFLRALAKGLACLAACVFARRFVESALRLPRQDALGRLALAIPVLVAIAAALAGDPNGWLRAQVFSVIPQSMFVLVALALVLILSAFAFWRDAFSPGHLMLLVAFALPALLAFRIAFGHSQYSIYYNGPVFLALLILLLNVIGPEYTALKWLVLIAFGATIAYGAFPYYRGALPWYSALEQAAPFDTGRGLIYASPAKIAAYNAAIGFMRQAASRGEKTLSVPEDTTLYFLAGVLPPTRTYVFTPGILNPGEMTPELLRQMDQAPVKYVIWSNRQTYEYGDSRFGSDYNQVIADHIRAHYSPVAHIGPGALGGEMNEPVRAYRAADWHATIWERRSEGAGR